MNTGAMIRNVLSKAGIAMICIAGGLWLGEVHPFSTYPMYNSFPDWAYVFYFTNEKNEPVPCSAWNTTGNELGHIYSAVCSQKQIAYGNQAETEEQLNEVGAEMMRILREKNNGSRGATHAGIKLWRACFSYGDSLHPVRTDQILNESR